MPPGLLVDRPRAAKATGRPAARCRAGWSTRFARTPEAKCRRAGWSTGRARPPESKCPRAGWSTALARPPDSKCPRGGWSTRPSREERKSTRATPDTQLRASWGHQEARSGDRRWVASRRPANPPTHSQDTITSFVTAATLIYALGAGITASPGTRLVLQRTPTEGFKLDSFQLQGLKRVHCFSSLPPEVGSG